MTIKTEKELADALKRGDEFIEIEGNLKEKTLKIRAVGKVAWAVAIAAIGVAVYATIATVGSAGTATPVTAPVSAFTLSSAVAVLGGTTTYSALAIAVSAGGVGALTSLRNYKEISRENGKLILRKR